MLYQGRLDVDGGGGEGFLLSGLFIPTKGVIRDLTVLPSVPISFLKYMLPYSGRKILEGKCGDGGTWEAAWFGLFIVTSVPFPLSASGIGVSKVRARFGF
jgi:hypothetical protein